MAEEVNIGEMWIEISENAGLTQMQRDVKEHTAEFKKLSATFEKIGGAVKGMIAAYVSMETFKATIGKAITQASKREQELLRLEAVMTAHGVKGKQIVGIYQDMAREISRTTMYTTGAAFAAEEKSETAKPDAITWKMHSGFSPNQFYTRAIRKNGYAFADSEVQTWLRAIAVPVFDHRGKVIASLGIISPEDVAEKKRIEALIEMLTGCASKISSELGFQAV